MIYTVDSMEGKSTKTGSSYTLKLESRNPDYQCTLLAVSKSQFDGLSVGDKIEIDITPQRAEPEASPATES